MCEVQAGRYWEEILQRSLIFFNLKRGIDSRVYNGFSADTSRKLDLDLTADWENPRATVLGENRNSRRDQLCHKQHNSSCRICQGEDT